MKIETRDLTLVTIFAALYAALVYIFAPVSFLALQFSGWSAQTRNRKKMDTSYRIRYRRCCRKSFKPQHWNMGTAVHASDEPYCRIAWAQSSTTI